MTKTCSRYMRQETILCRYCLGRDTSFCKIIKCFLKWILEWRKLSECTLKVLRVESGFTDNTFQVASRHVALTHPVGVLMLSTLHIVNLWNSSHLYYLQLWQRWIICKFTNSPNLTLHIPLYLCYSSSAFSQNNNVVILLPSKET